MRVSSLLCQLDVSSLDTLDKKLCSQYAARMRDKRMSMRTDVSIYASKKTEDEAGGGGVEEGKGDGGDGEGEKDEKDESMQDNDKPESGMFTL